MKSLDGILEIREINRWIRRFDRSPLQRNAPHASDAELVELGGNDDRLLAVTIDTVSEEIIRGIYREPFTMGWVTVMSCISDLAAVGADPLGVVVSVSVEPSRDRAFCDGIAGGMQAACGQSGVWILGGDTNTSPFINLTGCALGLVPRLNPLTRIGCRSGDRVYLSGPAGAGSAIGLVRLAGLPPELSPESVYRPPARIREGRLLRNYASCCMDTSDGVLATLDQLMRLNKVGFVVETDPKSILRSDVAKLADFARIPPWVMLAGHHGEFELLFTVPAARAADFQAEASRMNWSPLPIGRVVRNREIQLSLEDGLQTIDTGSIRNLFARYGNDPDAYVREILRCAS
jgi:thiamine-monophosphate kinase